MRAKLITICVTLLLLAAISTTEQIAVRYVTQGALDKAQAILSDIRHGVLTDAQKKAHALDEAWDRQAKLLIWSMVMICMEINWRTFPGILQTKR